MMRRLDQSHDNVVGYSLSGEVSDAEFTQAASELKDDIAREGRIRVLFRLRDISARSFTTAVKERFQFIQEHNEQLERIALVSDDTAAGLLGKVADLLPDTRLKTFPRRRAHRLGLDRVTTPRPAAPVPRRGQRTWERCGQASRR